MSGGWRCKWWGRGCRHEASNVVFLKVHELSCPCRAPKVKPPGGPR